MLIRGWMERFLKSCICSVVPAVFALDSFIAFGADAVEKRKIPDEYESVGGHGLGFNNMGAAAVGGISAVRTNPALIPLEKQYAMSAGYHWPTSGREFYSGGVVDSTTSSIGAGISYTGFTDHYKYPGEQGNLNGMDSPVARRVYLGLGRAYRNISVGVTGQFLEAYEPFSGRQEAVKGTTLGLGAAALLSPNLRIGITGENLANRKVANFAPRGYRGGASLIMAGGSVSLHGDYRFREQVRDFEACETAIFGLASSCNLNSNTTSGENTASISGSVAIYDVFRILASGAHKWPADKNLFAGGLALVNNSYSFSYLIQNPDINEKELHQAVNMSIALSM